MFLRFFKTYERKHTLDQITTNETLFVEFIISEQCVQNDAACSYRVDIVCSEISSQTFNIQGELKYHV